MQINVVKLILLHYRQRTRSQVRPRPLPSTFFPIHHLPVIPLKDIVKSEILTSSDKLETKYGAEISQCTANRLRDSD
jgi:hypothetical protein